MLHSAKRWVGAIVFASGSEIGVSSPASGASSERCELLEITLHEHDHRFPRYRSGGARRLLVRIEGLREPEENRIALEQYTRRVALQWAQEDAG